jgi:hypothetical protein
MPKHDLPTFVDAEAMTPAERLDRLVELLTRGVLRLAEERGLEARARRSPAADSGAPGEAPAPRADTP